MKKIRLKDSPRVCLLACYLEQQLGSDGCNWTVAIERPGNDGAFERTWHNATGQLTDVQGVDLNTYVARTFQDAIVAWNGIQEVPAR